MDGHTAVYIVFCADIGIESVVTFRFLFILQTRCFPKFKIDIIIAQSDRQVQFFFKEFQIALQEYPPSRIPETGLIRCFNLTTRFKTGYLTDFIIVIESESNSLFA